MSYQAGLTAYKSGDYQKAVDELHQAVEEDDQNHKAWNALGVVLTTTGDYETADTCYENALTLAPDTPAYQRNQDKNRVKWKAEEVLEVDDSVGIRIPKNRVKYYENEDRFSNKLAIILAVIGFFFGIIISGLTLILGGVGSAFGINGAESLITRSWVVILLSFIGVLASVIRHKRYAFIILILIGIFDIILLSLGGIIPGALFIIAGYMIFRETGLDLYYYLDFKSDIIKKGIFSIVILFCLIISIASIGTSGEGSTPPGSITGTQSQNLNSITSVPTPKSPYNGFTLSDVHFEEEKYVKYVVGIITNNKGRNLGYVQVEINLYDSSGNQIGSTLANVNNLEPGVPWKFKAIVLNDNAESFKVKDITGF